ncbi:hypothetical protein L873DRAFT_1803908, partial [Choiromyces venosus 120613-1]
WFDYYWNGATLIRTSQTMIVQHPYGGPLTMDVKVVYDYYSPVMMSILTSWILLAEHLYSKLL